MPIIESSQANQQVAVDLVKFGTRTQIIVFGNGAARAESEVRTICQLRRRDRYSLVQVRAHLVCIDSRIDEYLRSVVIHSMRGRIIIGIGAVASVFVPAVADESG